MGVCFGKSSNDIKKVHTRAYDLIDSDGDNVLSEQEIKYISSLIHREHVKSSSVSHNNLTQMKEQNYVYYVLGKNKGSKLKRKDFNKIAFSVSPTVWKTILLPALREKEIDRLRFTK